MSPPTPSQPTNSDSASIYDAIEANNLGWQSLPWRSCLFIGLSLFGLMFLSGLNNQWEGPSELISAFLISLLLGNSIFLSFLGGSCGRHWVVGYGMALAVTGVYLTGFFWMFSFGLDSDWRDYLFLLCLPGFCFICLLPYLAMRLFWGWRIMKSEIPPASLLIEDYLITMAIMGSSIALFRAYESIYQFMTTMYFDFMLPGVLWLSLGIGLMVLNLIVLIPLLVVFRMNNFGQRVLWAIGFTLGLLLAVFLMFGFFVFVSYDSSSSLGPDFAEIFLFYFWTGSWSAFYVIVGMEILRLDGFTPYTGPRLWGTSHRQPAVQTNQLIVSLDSADTTAAQMEPGQSALLQSQGIARVIDPFSDEEEGKEETKARATPGDLQLAHQRFWVRRFAVGLLILAVLSGVFAAMLG